MIGAKVDHPSKSKQKVALFLFYFGLVGGVGIGSIWGTLGGLIGIALGFLLSGFSLWIDRSKRRWIIWSIHGLILIGLYMSLYGVANIVGSGQKFSARMAVSTLRTLLWAEDQCIRYKKQACTFEELNHSVPVKGLETSVLCLGFNHLLSTPKGVKVGQAGQYYYAIYPQTEWKDAGWIGYAWPATDPTLATFCIHHREEVLEQSHRGGYVGLTQRPHASACFGDLHLHPDPPLTSEMKAAISQGKKPPPPVHIGGDQTQWQRWRGKRTRRAKVAHPLKTSRLTVPIDPVSSDIHKSSTQPHPEVPSP
jgi:hypothetical protein